MAVPPTIVHGAKPPPNPQVGGHYVQLHPGTFQLIHATGPGKWAPGPVPQLAPGLYGNNPVLNPNNTLSGPDLYHAAQALANAQVNPAIQGIQQQIGQNQQQSQGATNLTGGYFNQLLGQARQAAGNVAQTGAGLNSQLQQIAADENSQLQGLGQQATDALSRYTPGGVGQAGMTGLAAEIARQQGLAAQQEGAQRAFGARQGANYTGFANTQVGTGALRGQEDLTQIAKAGQLKNAPLVDKIAQLQAQRGALISSNVGRLRQQEITNQITRAGLGLKQQDLRLQGQAQAFNNNPNALGSPANARVQAGQTARQNANNSAKQTAFNDNPNAVGSSAWQRVQALQGRQWSNNPNAVGSPAWARVQRGAAGGGGGGGGGKPLPPVSNNAWFTHLGRVQSAITTWQQQGMKDKNGKVTVAHPTDAQMAQVLGGTYDPVMIQAAFELLGWGHITPQTAQAMHRLGVRGGTFRGAPIRQAPAPAPGPLSSVPLLGGALGGL